jgi:hypothetical protein
MDLSKFGYSDWKQSEAARVLKLDGIKRVNIDRMQIHVEFEDGSDVYIPSDDAKEFSVDVSRMTGVDELNDGRDLVAALSNAIGRHA